METGPIASMTLGVYGFWLLFVVLAGNGGRFVENIKLDARGFVPWVIVGGALVMLYSSGHAKTIVKPLALLIVLNTVLSNWDTVKEQFSTITRGVM